MWARHVPDKSVRTRGIEVAGYHRAETVPLQKVAMVPTPGGALLLRGTSYRNADKRISAAVVDKPFVLEPDQSLSEGGARRVLAGLLKCQLRLQDRLVGARQQIARIVFGE